MGSEGMNGVRVVCVTGGGGYIGSWLVKNLLQGGYTVHATLRNPGDTTKCGPLMALAGAQERLKLFQADLLEEDIFDSALTDNSKRYYQNDMYYKAFKFAQFLTGSIGVVHIDDICNAHIFLMEHPTAQGRRICCTDSRSLNSLKECIAKQLNLSLKFDEEDSVNHYVSVSSKKLLDMGFTYKYGLEEAFKETIDCAIQNGILKL
ncbi:putative anthocyanidin reductase [Cryptomeria japonica]|uniref:putative anthocyanidin reductase n=1 Tax=Cryptomeria japonica TaxID=3369 RepID=UPI0025ACD911|nr:putative anthocyanidin reductase [Cryptomeria japonica]